MGRIDDDVQEQSLQAAEQQGNETSTEDVAAEPLQKLQAERDALFDRLARLQAEFDNYRKRSQREQQDFRDYALTDFAKQFLPILDSFDRALKTTAGDSELSKGMELIHRQMEDALAKAGVKAISAKGEPFDPRLHEAVEVVEQEDAGDNEVIDELQRGYLIKGRLLRPAMVRVARNHK